MARRVISSGKDVQGIKPKVGEKVGRSVSSKHTSDRSAEDISDRKRSISSGSVDSGTNHSKAEGFVDARRLQSEDLVSKTLQETTGTIGVMTRPKVVDFNARLKERRKAGARVIAMRTLIGIAITAALGVIVWLFFFSSVFRLEPGNISVVGANEWVSESQVFDIAKQQSGKSLFLVSDTAVEKRIKAIPGVTSVESKKHLPNFLEVTIKAQKPAAMLKTGEDKLTAVDSKGRVLNSVSGASVEGIPVIEVQDVETSLSERSIKEALKILSSLPESMRNSITKVTAATQDSITTELNGGERVIVWGDSSDLKLKKAVVDKIINDPNVIGDKHNVDVSAPLRPIIK
ncbi:MAG: FtsQ-type POTRA domain-containing protein [Bifidobacterium ruminantium]|uniref:cell division protein FtsQ/DivIB n=1 Tax=uncultured Bifidobacterium sp. TaxID=165187 RepID=UPI00258993E0|nr:FtsQ-type POTRA domain-containing protein [uncultured Bifidobacterium sp.]MEE0971941.1 FtsQ-type POTRA domain-containing protein [Bifidobacterium ruminantium]